MIRRHTGNPVSREDIQSAYLAGTNQDAVSPCLLCITEPGSYGCRIPPEHLLSDKKWIGACTRCIKKKIPCSNQLNGHDIEALFQQLLPMVERALPRKSLVFFYLVNPF
jgi:hypothetical protein